MKALLFLMLVSASAPLCAEPEYSREVLGGARCNVGRESFDFVVQKYSVPPDPKKREPASRGLHALEVVDSTGRLVWKDSRIWRPGVAGSDWDLAAIACSSPGRSLWLATADLMGELWRIEIFEVIPEASAPVDSEMNREPFEQFTFRDAPARSNRILTIGESKGQLSISLPPANSDPKDETLEVSLDLRTGRFSKYSFRWQEPDRWPQMMYGLRDYVSMAVSICRMRANRVERSGAYASSNVTTLGVETSLRGDCPQQLKLDWLPSSVLFFDQLDSEYLVLLYGYSPEFYSTTLYRPEVGTVLKVLRVFPDAQQEKSLEVLDPRFLAFTEPIPADLLSLANLKVDVLGKKESRQVRVVRLDDFLSWASALKPRPLEEMRDDWLRFRRSDPKRPEGER